MKGKDRPGKEVNRFLSIYEQFLKQKPGANTGRLLPELKPSGLENLDFWSFFEKFAGGFPKHQNK